MELALRDKIAGRSGIHQHPRPTMSSAPAPGQPYISPWMDQDLAMFRDAVSRFVESEMVPQDEHWRQQKHVGHEIWRKAGAQGLLCTDIPAEYGGAGGDFRHEAVVYEETQRRGLSGFGQGVHSISARVKLLVA